MATSGPIEHNQVMVTGNMCPQLELDRVSNAVCLLKPNSGVTGLCPKCLSGTQRCLQINYCKEKVAGFVIRGVRSHYQQCHACFLKGWKGTGFYVKIETSSVKKIEVHCIMTANHVFRETENTQEMVAVFQFLGDNKSPVEVILKPSDLYASCKELDYALVRVDKKSMSSLKIEPIDADFPKVDRLNLDDVVYIIQHPEGREKHISFNNIRNIDPPFIKYSADTLGGSSGSPVIVVAGNKCALVALHCKGVKASPSNYNKGTLMSEILNHLKTGNYTKPSLNVTPGVPGMLESDPSVSTGSKKLHLPVTDKDINAIALHIVKVWKAMARALELPVYTVESIDGDNDKDYEKSYQMLTKWKQTKVAKANYEALATAFSDPAVGRDDLISDFC